MIPPKTIRPAAALALAAGLFLALPGCGGDKPPASKPEDKKADPKPNSGGTKLDPKVDPKPDPKVDFSAGVGKDAVEFLTAVGKGEAKADKLSAGFAKMIGLPLLTATDKAQGFSPDAAESWLKRVGGGFHGFGPPMFAKQFGDAAVVRGTFAGGTYFLRMVNEAGAWKVDGFALTSAKCPDTGADPAADAALQEFATVAAAGLIADKDAMPHDERAMAIAAALTPAARTRWADPFASDKDQGFDYNRGRLATEAAKIGGGTESFALAKQGDAAFKVELTKAGGAKSAYLVKLAKGTTPGQWLVDDVTPQ